MRSCGAIQRSSQAWRREMSSQVQGEKIHPWQSCKKKSGGCISFPAPLASFLFFLGFDQKLQACGTAKDLKQQ